MVETIEEIISIVFSGLALTSAVTGFIFSLIKNCKNKKIVKAAQTVNEICELAAQKVAEVEKLFPQQSGAKTGDIKKESVMAFIKERCDESGISFDFDYWSGKVEKLVTVLNVNKT